MSIPITTILIARPIRISSQSQHFYDRSGFDINIASASSLVLSTSTMMHEVNDPRKTRTPWEK
nr:hypothetical protein [uncultured Undibacterium sp.]